jgi:hypothetical protein
VPASGTQTGGHRAHHQRQQVRLLGNPAIADRVIGPPRGSPAVASSPGSPGNRAPRPGLGRQRSIPSLQLGVRPREGAHEQDDRRQRLPHALSPYWITGRLDRLDCATLSRTRPPHRPTAGNADRKAAKRRREGQLPPARPAADPCAAMAEESCIDIQTGRLFCGCARAKEITPVRGAVHNRAQLSAG